MSDAVHDLSHVTEALANLAGFLKNKPNTASLVTAYVAEVQALEDALWQLLTQRDLNSAVGAQLDGLGDILGFSRGGLNDTDYRLQLRAKILLDIISGGINEIIALLQDLIPGAAITIVQSFPAAFTALTSIAPSDPTTVGNLLRSGTAAGVGSQLIYSTVALSSTFTTSSSLVANSSLGFADSANPGTGGHLAGSA